MSYQPKILPWPEHFDGLLPVSEIFYSIQGEGRFAGSPALFVRLKYCNLGCAWCDTRFTWDVDKIEEGRLMSPSLIVEAAERLLGDVTVKREDVHVVITGGEPMLHQDRIPSLLGKLQTLGLAFIEVETNGMYVPKREMMELVSWWNCSPKLSNSGIPVSRNRVPAALVTILATQRCDFKFVIQSARDIDEMERFYMPPLPAAQIMLMPEGVTVDSQTSISHWLMDECRVRGYRFSPRLHVLAWGNERGR